MRMGFPISRRLWYKDPVFSAVGQRPLGNTNALELRRLCHLHLRSLVASGFKGGDEEERECRKEKGHQGVGSGGSWSWIQGPGPSKHDPPGDGEEQSIPDTFSTLHFASGTMQSSRCQ